MRRILDEFGIATLLLLIAGWVSVSLIGDVFARDGAQPRQSLDTSPSFVPITMPTLASPDAKSLEMVLNRPLFDPARKPAPKVEKELAPLAAVTPTPARGQYDLAAVLIVDGSKTAMLRRSEEDDLIRVSVGETLSDWTVSRIERDVVHLKAGGVVDVVYLRDE